MFNDSEVRDRMCEVLYIWARENPDYQYQQGMNDILAVIMICLASELSGDIQSTQRLSNFDNEMDFEQDATTILSESFESQVFNELHSF